jgi:hypothetical protein
MKSVYQEEEYSTVGLRGWIWDIVEKPDNYELQPGEQVLDGGEPIEIYYNKTIITKERMENCYLGRELTKGEWYWILDSLEEFRVELCEKIKKKQVPTEVYTDKIPLI